jgi:hypothetical protein
MNRNIRVQVLLTQKEFDIIKKKSSSIGETMSSFLRKVILMFLKIKA